MKNYQLIRVPGAGHWVHHDQLELFLRETKKFLAWIANLQRVVVAIDKNNYADNPLTPTRRFRCSKCRSTIPDPSTFPSIRASSGAR